MGVDYNGHFGIGVKIANFDFDDEETPKEIRDLGCMCEFLDDKLDGDKFGWFEVGEGIYDGTENEHYVYVQNPFENGIKGLSDKKDNLISHLSDIGVCVKSDFGAIGGLEIW